MPGRVHKRRSSLTGHSERVILSEGRMERFFIFRGKMVGN